MQICLIICNICQSWDRSGHSKNFGYESAKSRASRVYVLPSSRAYVLACLRALRACVSACVRACVRACYDEMFYFLTCLRTWYAFLSYLFYISIPKFKNSYSKKLLCFAKLDIFVIYILIPNYKTI